MKTAVVTLALGEYWRGAKVLFHTLERYGGLPDSVARVALGMDECDFAYPVPVASDYSWVAVNKLHFAHVANKFEALTLPYDRIILLDADILCVGDCSLLWSDVLDTLEFYAVRDVASVFYYGKIIRQIRLDHNLLFNGGTMVFDRSRFPLTTFLGKVADGTLLAYDGGDQGYLNHWFQKTKTPFGFLPLEYNACTDQHFPRMQDGTARLVHFTGSNVNPWAPTIGEDDRRWPLILKWREEWDRCNR